MWPRPSHSAGTRRSRRRAGSSVISSPTGRDRFHHRRQSARRRPDRVATRHRAGHACGRTRRRCQRGPPGGGPMPGRWRRGAVRRGARTFSHSASPAGVAVARVSHARIRTRCDELVDSTSATRRRRSVKSPRRAEPTKTSPSDSRATPVKRVDSEVGIEAPEAL